MDADDWLNVAKGRSLPESADVQTTVKPSLATD